jgi:chemotaxis signal transduction protein
MRRFTVSLPDDLYQALRRRGEESAPPATLQQMLRHAVDTMLQQAVLADAAVTKGDEEPAPAESTVVEPAAVESVDLLVFAVDNVSYGIPIELVETVAARLAIHPVPTTSGTLLGVAGFRDTLTEVHDGGTLLQNRPLDPGATPTLLAIPGRTARVLLTVSSVTGLTPARDLWWAHPPGSSPPWVSALAWTDKTVITVLDPTVLNL